MGESQAKAVVKGMPFRKKDRTGVWLTFGLHTVRSRSIGPWGRAEKKGGEFYLKRGERYLQSQGL